MRIAFFFKENISNKKGSYRATINRIKYLMQVMPDETIDSYLIQFYYNKLSCWLNGKEYENNKPSVIESDGLRLKVVWVKIRFIDVLKHRFGCATRNSIEIKRLQAQAQRFPKYDIISAHSRYGGIIAKEIAKRQSIPFFITWHGTDIHTAPYLNKEIFNVTFDLLVTAKCNFFVSNALREEAKKICPKMSSDVLYNGVGKEFFLFSKDTRKQYRHLYAAGDKKIIAFCGNLVQIKNVSVLPSIFRQVVEKSDSECVFWIIGDGPLRKELELGLSKMKCRFWGNQPLEKMPGLFNCVDVLILPSLNEGLPLVAIEALSCGANVVGSNVGGIPEVIGNENSFDLDDMFVTNISNRALQMLKYNISQAINVQFNWQKSAEKEANHYIQC